MKLEELGKGRIGLRTLAYRLYVPLASLLLVLLAGHWIAIRAGRFDPETALQNQYLRFQKSGDAAAGKLDGLTPAEAAAADRVIADWYEPTQSNGQVLFLGNSQTMAINDYRAGDMVAAQWLQVSLLRQIGTREAPALVLGSLPNITMPETVARTVEFSESRGRRLKQVIVALTLREWRGVGIRPEVQNEIAAHQLAGPLAELIGSNRDLVHGDTVLQGTLQALKNSAGTAESGSAPPVSSRVERTLQKFAGNNSVLFKSRPYIVVELFIQYMRLRDWLLGIKSDAPRPIPFETYRANLEMVELLIRYARARNCDLVIYLAPIRPLQPNPTLASDLARFRADLPKLCARYHATCLDYSDLVPETKGMWTDYPDIRQPDYAHFTGAAHRLLARRLAEDIGSRLTLAAAPRSNAQ